MKQVLSFIKICKKVRGWWQIVLYLNGLKSDKLVKMCFEGVSKTSISILGMICDPFNTIHVFFIQCFG